MYVGQYCGLSFLAQHIGLFYYVFVPCGNDVVLTCHFDSKKKTIGPCVNQPSQHGTHMDPHMSTTNPYLLPSIYRPSPDMGGAEKGNNRWRPMGREMS